MSQAPADQHLRFAGYRLRCVFPDSALAQSRVRALMSSALRARGELVGVQGKRNGSGRHDGEFWESQGWFLKTRKSLVFADEVDAVRTFARISAFKVRLGVLTPERSMVSVLEDPFGKLEVWTIAPVLRTLREDLERAHGEGDQARLRQLLIGYAHCLGLALQSAEEQNLSLDPNPANFAAQGGRPRYIDDDVAERDDAVGIEDAFLGRFVDYPDADATTLKAYLGRFVDEVRVAVSSEFRRKLLLETRIQNAAILKRGSAPWAERAVLLLRA